MISRGWLSRFCRKIVDETVSKWGRIDVLVNNAAFQGKLVEKFEDIERSRLERTFHTNILVSLTTNAPACTYDFIRLLLPVMHVGSYQAAAAY